MAVLMMGDGVNKEAEAITARARPRKSRICVRIGYRILMNALSVSARTLHRARFKRLLKRG